MNQTPLFRRLLNRSLAALLLAAALVALCYFFVDRPVAFFVHDQGLSGHRFLDWLTYPPPIAQAWTPLALALVTARRAWGPLSRAQRALMAASVAMVLADQFRESLSFLLGRYWPETWIDNNPSLIKDGAYGFHPFHGGSAYGSFPSGHMARTLAVVAVVWTSYPRWRLAGALAGLAVAAGLLGMNYHFTGDVIAGGFVGAVVGMYSASFCGLSAPVHVAAPALTQSEETASGQ